MAVGDGSRIAEGMAGWRRTRLPKAEQTFLRPIATMWYVPKDDTHTMAFAFRRAGGGA